MSVPIFLSQFHILCCILLTIFFLHPLSIDDVVVSEPLVRESIATPRTPNSRATLRKFHYLNPDRESQPMVQLPQETERTIRHPSANELCGLPPPEKFPVEMPKTEM